MLAVSKPPMYDFIFDLVVDPRCTSLTGSHYGCQCSGTFRFDRAELDALALEWASDENLTWPDRVGLLLNLDKLPWDQDEITFHWGEYTESVAD